MARSTRVRTCRGAVLVGIAAIAALGSRSDAQCQSQRLTSSEIAQSHEFGWSVGLWGTWAVIGAKGVSGGGAAYVFVQQGGVWSEVQKLVPSDPASVFGRTVAIEGDTLVVSGHGNGHGVVYVFELLSGAWIQVQKLVPPDGGQGDDFGCALALSGNRLLIGARLDSDINHLAGSAYVFEKAGGSWVRTAKLTANPSVAGDFLGEAVALSGDRALIGAPRQSSGGANEVGAAYLFELTTSGWTQVQMLKLAGGAQFDYFGQAVALDGDRAVIGARGRDDVHGDAGAAYAYELQGGTWVQSQALFASDAAQGDEFGRSVALDSDWLLVGAWLEDDLGSQAGAAYAFRRVGGSWIQSAKLLPEDGDPGDLFGLALAIQGSTALIGSNDSDPCGGWVFCDAGAAYVIELAPSAVQFCSCGAGSPCGNADDHGGCLTSTGAGALLGACGVGSVSADDLVLVSTHLPPQAMNVLFMSQSAGGPFVMGDGLRCVVGSPFRFPPSQADPLGKAIHAALVSQSAGSISVGSTWYFQSWFRDLAGPCGSGHNLSNGVVATFAP